MAYKEHELMIGWLSDVTIINIKFEIILLYDTQILIMKPFIAKDIATCYKP